MAPYLQPAPLAQLSIEALQNVLFRVIRSRDSVYYEHDENTGQVREILEENVREEVLGYVCDMLPSCLQTKMILNLVRMSELQSPHLVIELLFSEKLQNLTLELTHAGSDFMSKIAAEEGRGARISAEDIAKTLDAFERIFTERSPSEFRYLQKFLLVDTSEDPDFQGDPLNNLTNTNREGGGGRGARFIGVDVIRMPFKNIPTLILLLNFCTYIILVFKFIKGILFLFDLDGETRGKNNAL